MLLASLGLAGTGVSSVGGYHLLARSKPGRAAGASLAAEDTVSDTPLGLRLGPENNALVFSGGSTGSRALGLRSGALGPDLYRAVQLPANYANIPASGDHWLVLFFRTAAVCASQARQETLLGVRGGKLTGVANGGALYFDSPGHLVGSATSGQDVSPVAGRLQCQRKNGAYQLWPQTKLGAATSIVVAPDTDYALFFGIHRIGGSDFGEMIVVNLADASIQTAQSPQGLRAGRATDKAMFDQIGAMGSAAVGSDALGFGGCVGRFAVWDAPFPTVTQAQAIASGASSIDSVTTLLGSGALIYWNELDFAQIGEGSLPARVGASARIVGANVTAAAPIIASAAVTLRRLGAHHVFPMACGARDGNVWFEGAAPPGSLVTCQLNYIGAEPSDPVQVTASDTGLYSVAIRSVGGKPFYRQVVVASGNTASTLLDGDIMDVGVVIPILGQSECNILNAWINSGASVDSDNYGGNSGHSLPMPGAYSGPWASWVDAVSLTSSGTQERRSPTGAVRPQIMLGIGIPGDGMVQACSDLIKKLNCSVMLVMLTRSGTPMDASLLDGQTFTLAPTLAGAGSAEAPYATSLAIGAGDVRAKFGTPGFILHGRWINGVQPGSVTLAFPNAGAPVVVRDVFAGYADSSTCIGVLTGDNGASGSIDYLTGVVRLAFATPPDIQGYTATWTIKQETLAASYKSKTAYIDGCGVREAIDQVGRVGLRYGWSFAWHWWITANLTDSNTVAGTAANLTAKLGLLQEMMTGGPHFPGYIAPGLSIDAGCAAPPMVVAPKGRDRRQLQPAAVLPGHRPPSPEVALAWRFGRPAVRLGERLVFRRHRSQRHRIAARGFF